MSRTELVAIPAERRDHARHQLRSRRVSAASVLALVDAAADAMQEGRIGSACDLLAAVCSPARAERILVELLDTPARPDREAVG